MISAYPWADHHPLKGPETTEDQHSSVVLSPRGPSEDEEEDGEEDEVGWMSRAKMKKTGTMRQRDDEDDRRSRIVLFFFVVLAVLAVTANAAPALPQRSVTANATVYRRAPIPLYFVIFLNNAALFMPQFAPNPVVTARHYRLAATAPATTGHHTRVNTMLVPYTYAAYAYSLGFSHAKQGLPKPCQTQACHAYLLGYRTATI